MKRLIGILLIALMLLPLPIEIGRADTDETVVRVRLSTGDATSVDVSLSGEYAVGDVSLSGGTVTAAIKDGVITVSHSSQGKLQSSKTSVRLVRVGTDDGTRLTFQNAKHGKRVYYGDFVFYNDSGTLRVLNYVDMRHYLYGVVSGELSDTSKPDFLKVETIIAKGYALAEVEARKSKYFDVYDTTQSQLYYGFVESDKNTIAAVDAVWTQTLRFKGKTVKTYYSTANGGQMLTPRIRWGGTENEGAYCFGYDPFDLMGSSKNVTFTIDGTSPKDMYANLYAFLLSKTNAKELVSVDAVTGIYDTANPNGTSRYPSTLAPQTQYDWTLTVKDREEQVKTVQFSCTPDEVKAAIAPSAAGAICFVVRISEHQWRLVWGVNSGHRAGLSHRGAGQMVKLGYSYVDVLKFYFRGATLYDENGSAIESDMTFAFTYEDGATASPDPAKYEVIVTSETLNLREGPSANTTLLGTFRLGTVLSVLQEVDGWYRVREEKSGMTGYVSASYASYYERNPKPQWEGVCNADNSNLRIGPSANFQKLYAIDRDRPLYIYYRSGNWYFVMDRVTGQGAFIYSAYVTLGGGAPTVTAGDADGSGTVDASDASRILRYLVKLASLEDGQLLAADVNGDGTVDASDAAIILRRAVGLE